MPMHLREDFYTKKDVNNPKSILILRSQTRSPKDGAGCAVLPGSTSTVTGGAVSSVIGGQFERYWQMSPFLTISTSQ